MDNQKPRWIAIAVATYLCISTLYFTIEFGTLLIGKLITLI